LKKMDTPIKSDSQMLKAIQMGGGGG